MAQHVTIFAQHRLMDVKPATVIAAYATYTQPVMHVLTFNKQHHNWVC